MPEPAELLRAYDAQLRGEAEVAAADGHERVGPLWRTRWGDDGFVTYESLAGHDLEALVRQSVAHFRDATDVASFEWKTRGHDDLPGLHDVLLAHGFVAEELETVMVGEAAALAVEVPLADGLVVRRVEDAATYAEVTALQPEVFGSDAGDLAERVARGEGRIEVWAAFDEAAGGRMVSAGRVEVVPGTSFAGLWGGGTLEGYRGRGVYRALTAARARSVMARGATLLHSDCTAMSCPILERSGLVAVTTTTPYVWTRPGAVGSMPPTGG